MSKNPEPKIPAAKSFQVRLPGFIGDEEVGLGQVITRITSAVGIRLCDGCRKRAAALNRWASFSNKLHK